MAAPAAPRGPFSFNCSAFSSASPASEVHSSSCPSAPSSRPLHLKQTLQESSLLFQQGGLFARQLCTGTTQGFMHSWNSPTHWTLLLLWLQSWRSAQAPDFIWSALCCVWLSTYCKVLVTVFFFFFAFSSRNDKFLRPPLHDSREKYGPCLLHWNQSLLNSLVPFYHSWFSFIVSPAPSFVCCLQERLCVCLMRSFSQYFTFRAWRVSVEIGCLGETM